MRRDNVDAKSRKKEGEFYVILKRGICGGTMGNAEGYDILRKINQN